MTLLPSTHLDRRTGRGTNERLGMRSMAGLLLLVLGGSACTAERSVSLDMTVPAERRGLICLAVYDGPNRVYAQHFDAADANGTLTFIEGQQVQGSAEFFGVYRRGGRAVLRSAATGSFAPSGESVARLRFDGCQPRDRAPTQVSLGSLAGATRIYAGDNDGDGRDEIFGVGEQVQSNNGATIAADEIVTIADYDGDCIDDLIVRRADATIAITRSAERTLDVSGMVLLGDAGDGAHAAIGNATGLYWLMQGASSPRVLSNAAVRSIAIGDLNGDDRDEILLAHDGGVEAWFGSEVGPTSVLGAVPSEWIPTEMQLGDIDGDGALDLVTSQAGRIRVARNRGDGLLEARPVPASQHTHFVVLDVDGDCASDVVLIDEADQVLWLRGGPDARLASPVSLGAGVDVTRADVDGDGTDELIILRMDGQLEIGP